MTKQEIIERNIGLTFDFVHHLIDNNEELNKLPEKFDVEFIDKDFPKMEMKPTAEVERSIPKKFVQVKRTFSVRYD